MFIFDSETKEKRVQNGSLVNSAKSNFQFHSEPRTVLHLLRLFQYLLFQVYLFFYLDLFKYAAMFLFEFIKTPLINRCKNNSFF